MLESNYYLATTYLKLVLGEPELAQIVRESVGDELADLIGEEYVGAEHIEPIFAAFDRAGLDSWVLRFGNKLSSTTHAALGFAALSAPTLRDSLQVFCDYACVRTNAYRMSILEVDQRLHLICEDQTGNALLGRWLIETAMYVEKRLIENIMTHTIGEQAEIHFQFGAPSYATDLAEFYGIRCCYHQQNHAFIIPSSWGYVPSPLHDPETFQTNLAKCRDIKRRLESKNSTLDFVKAELEHFFQRVLDGTADPANIPTQTALADQLALAPRTFARRLAQQHSSYKQELARTRRQFAQDLLQNTHLRIADIAYYLGYQEIANFIRAFKQWAGCTPSQWRRSMCSTSTTKQLNDEPHHD